MAVSGRKVAAKAGAGTPKAKAAARRSSASKSGASKAAVKATARKSTAGKPAADATARKSTAGKPSSARPASTAAAGSGSGTSATRAAGKHGAAPTATGDLAARFRQAAADAKKPRERPDNATLLRLYSYYKQATEGDVTGSRPGGFDFVGAAKHDAWARLKGMTRDDAMSRYIAEVERLDRE